LVNVAGSLHDEFQDRLFFGTDICAPANFEFVRNYIRFLIEMRDNGEISAEETFIVDSNGDGIGNKIEKLLLACALLSSRKKGKTIKTLDFKEKHVIVFFY